MSENTSSPSVPIFKDKIMYIKLNSGKQDSYVVSSSYQGIVRLSPNNLNVINQVTTSQLNQQDETDYQDAISFDGTANSQFEQYDISHRMLVATDSIGNKLGFRMSDKDLEIDHLGILGRASFDNLFVFSNDSPFIPNPNDGKETNNQKSFLIKDEENGITVAMPTSLEARKSAAARNFDDYNKLDFSINLEENRCNEILLSDTQDGKNFYFKPQLINDEIDDYIIECMLQSCSLPTGSIHWFNVKMQDYLKYLDQVKPNSDYDGVGVKLLCRDYLLCDGRKYYNKDFPQLARVLLNEEIVYWGESESTNDISNMQYINKFSNTYQKNANPEEQVATPKCFRVPDLRTKFITYIKSNGGQPLKNQINDGLLNLDTNRTGYYTPDNLPSITSNESSQQDKHFHFIAYGTYGWRNRTNSLNFGWSAKGDDNIWQNPKTKPSSFTVWENITEMPKKVLKDDPIQQSVVEQENEEQSSQKKQNLNLQLTNTPAMWYLHNHPGYRMDRSRFLYTLREASGLTCGFGYPWGRHGLGSAVGNENGVLTGESIGCAAYASRPKIITDGQIGRKTGDASIAYGKKRKEAFDDKNIDSGKSSYAAFQGSETSNFIESLINGNNYIIDDEAKGKENTPTYYALLPFIKI